MNKLVVRKDLFHDDLISTLEYDIDGDEDWCLEELEITKEQYWENWIDFADRIFESYQFNSDGYGGNIVAERQPTDEDRKNIKRGLISFPYSYYYENGVGRKIIDGDEERLLAKEAIKTHNP